MKFIYIHSNLYTHLKIMKMFFKYNFILQFDLV